MIRSGHYFKWKEYLAVTQKEKGCELATKYLCGQCMWGVFFQGNNSQKGDEIDAPVVLINKKGRWKSEK